MAERRIFNPNVHERPDKKIEAKDSVEGEVNTVELKDAEGNVICDAEYEYGEPDEKGRKEILSIKLGKGESEVDLFDLINHRGTKVLVSEGSFMYNPDDNAATVSSPENPLHLIGLMHEIGHANQFGEEEFQQTAGANPFQKYALSDPQYWDGSDGRVLTSVFDQFKDKFGAQNLEAYSEVLKVGEAYVEKEKERDQHVAELTETRKNYVELISNFLKDHSRINTDVLSGKEFKDSPGFGSVEIQDKLAELGIKYDQSYLETVSGPNKGEEHTEENNLRNAFQNTALTVKAITEGRKVEDANFTFEGGKIVADIPIKLIGDYVLHSVVELEGSEDEMTQLNLQKDKLKAKAIEDLQAIDEVEKELEAATEVYTEITKKYSKEIEDIFLYPVKKMERDASRRALLWMRELKQKYNIDLLVPLPTTDMLQGLGEHVKGSETIPEVVTSMISEMQDSGELEGGDSLRMALGAYAATGEEMREQYK